MASGLFAGLLILSVLLLPVQPVSAQTPPPLKQDLWVTNGGVRASVLSGNTLFIGGAFTRVGPPSGGWVGWHSDTAELRTDWPRVAGTVAAMVADGSGGWFIGGEFSAVGGVSRSNLAHIRADRTLNPAWAPQADKPIRAMALNGTTLYLGGEFTEINGLPRTAFAALNAANGELSGLNPTIGHPTVTGVNTLAVGGTTLFIGGLFDQVNGQPRTNLAAFDLSTGSLLPFSPNPNSIVSALAVSGSTLFVGGMFNQIALNPRRYLAAVNSSTGAIVPAFNANIAQSMVNRVSVILKEGGSLYFGGIFATVGGQPRLCAAAVNPGNGLLLPWKPDIQSIDPVYSTQVLNLALSGNTIFVGGEALKFGTGERNYLAAVDASTGALFDWDPDPGGAITTLAIGDNTVFAGGKIATVKGWKRNGLAALDLVSGLPTDWDPNVNGSVWTTALSGERLYIGGQFTQVGGQTRNNIAAVDRGSGSLVPAWNPNAGNFVEALAVSGDKVFAGGGFLTIGGQNRIGLAQLDSQNGNATAWSANTDGSSVKTMMVNGNTLYVGGMFTQIKGKLRNRLAAVNITTAEVLSWDPNVIGPLFPSVYDLSLFGETLYFAGYFNQVKGLARNNLAAVDALSGAPKAWDPNPDSESIARVVAARAKAVYVGGLFSEVGGRARKNMAVLDPTTGSAQDWNPEIGGVVTTLAVGDRMVFAGGTFNYAGTLPQANLAGIYLLPIPLNLPLVTR